MKVKEESEKVGLKLSIQKINIMASSPITTWHIDGETVETVADFILGGSKITADGDCSHEIKRRLLLGRKVVTNLVQFIHSVVSDSLRRHESQHTRPPCPLPTPRVYSNSCPSSRWCHPTTSSSVVPFSSCLQSFPASGSFPMSQLFTWGGQSIGVSASASVRPVNTQDWSPLGWTGWISLQTNLDSILKSRDITLPTKVHLVKAMVFPVVMYGCESWTMKKAEHQRIDAFELWCWRGLLKIPWTVRRSN